MKRFLHTVLASLALAFSVAAQTMQWSVTPNQLEYSNFVFSVTTQPTNNGGTAFHVTITTKTEPIQPDSVVSLMTVAGTRGVPVISPVDPAVPVSLQKTNNIWTVDFNASGVLLTDPTVNLIFVVTDYRTNPDGTRTYLPSDRMYEIRLQDFLKLTAGFGS